MLTGFFAISILIMAFFPKTPLARSLHRWLVEWPLDMAARMQRRHVLLILILLCAGQAIAMIGGTELAIAYAADMSIYADVVLLGYLASATTRLRSGWWIIRSTVTRAVAPLCGRKPRSRRKRCAAPRRESAANDDGPARTNALRAA